ncbi:MAG: tyrosine-type recombinase/integrase [Chloroflexi bacterium]|nr:tyrosine-type recombinase/integrase [Chloroflexota bacterium]
MAGVLHVQQVLHHLRTGESIFTEPKSQKGRRAVALLPSAVLALGAHKEKQEEDWVQLGKEVTPDTLVFAQSPDERPLLPNTITHAFIKLVRGAGLCGVRFHDLRHTHASLLFAQNVHPEVVSERWGIAWQALPWIPTST